MAFNKAPTSLWPSYTYGASTLSIPLAALDGLSAANADASTGDWRAIMIALMQTMFRHYSGLATADRPTALIPKAPASYNVPDSSSTYPGALRLTYSVDAYTAYSSPTIKAEA